MPESSYIIIGIKPNDQFQKKWLESTKIPIWKVLKIPNEMHEKHEIKCKRKGTMDLPAYREENLAKNLEENEQKICGLALSNSERQKVWKPLLKSKLEQVKSDF